MSSEAVAGIYYTSWQGIRNHKIMYMSNFWLSDVFIIIRSNLFSNNNKSAFSRIH